MTYSQFFQWCLGRRKPITRGRIVIAVNGKPYWDLTTSEIDRLAHFGQTQSHKLLVHGGDQLEVHLLARGRE